MTTLQTDRPGFRRNTDRSARRLALQLLLTAVVLTVGVYTSELLRLLEKPLFSKVYYGNLNQTFFALSAAAYIYLFIFLLHRFVKKHFGVSPFARHRPPLALSRKAILYLLTALPILLTAAALNFRFKLIYELGERITGMTLLGNAVTYFFASARLFGAIYLIFLFERGCDSFFAKRPPLPFGGLAALLIFGACELIFNGSQFVWLYALLLFYDGILYLISGKRFAVTYTLALLLYIL